MGVLIIIWETHFTKFKADESTEHLTVLNVSYMNVVPGQKSSHCVSSAERAPKAVSSGADAAKCVSGVRA